ncbi:MAG: hypothetical protein QM702_07535 [Rubrivivax sp.]
MGAKVKPCTRHPRHAWTWVKNVTIGRPGSGVMHFALKGRYRCACGATKLGAPDHRGTDLRGLLGMPSKTAQGEAS